MSENYYEDYCTSCGLCSEFCGVKFIDKRGFDVPCIETKEQLDFCKKVCPVNGHHFNNSSAEIWGNYIKAFCAWSSDSDVRFRSASGGVLTSLCIYLLDNKVVDGVIQVGEDTKDPLGLKLYINVAKHEVITCSGSRYITGLTYKHLLDKIDYEKRYAVVGKPCDIEALTNLCKFNKELEECIKYRLSFFCAGAPGRTANKQLISALVANVERVKSIRYRGMGWPGKATVLCENEDYQMSYSESWNNILGRDIRKMCKFCVDGIGEVADISCGDLWNLNDNGMPDFLEKDGKNIVFVRSKEGMNLWNDACANGNIVAEEYNDFEILKKIQPNHFSKRSTAFGKVIGLVLCLQKKPNFNIKRLAKLSKNVGLIKNVKTSLGTIKRFFYGRV